MPASSSHASLPEPLTVSEVLALPLMDGAEVLAGAAGLDVRVSRMNMMEVPDVLPWVRPREVLVTSGYPLRDHSEGELLALLNGLRAKGVAALVVKVGGRYLPGLPATVRQAADRLRLPVISMPLQLAFTDLQETYFAEVVERHRQALRDQERARDFAESLRQVLNERSTASEPELAEVLARLGWRGGAVVHVCVLGAPLADARGYERTARRLRNALEPALEERIIMQPYADHICAVVRAEDIQALTSILGVQGVEADPRLGELRIGVGNVATDLTGWRRSYGQAARALQLTSHLVRGEHQTPVVWFSRTGIHQVVELLLGAEGTQFVDEALGPLDRHPELRETLHVLLDANGSIAETADRTHFHYNTIRNRVRRIESLIGPFMDSGRRRAELLLACEARSRAAHDQHPV